MHTRLRKVEVTLSLVSMLVDSVLPKVYCEVGIEFQRTLQLNVRLSVTAGHAWCYIGKQKRSEIPS